MLHLGETIPKDLGDPLPQSWQVAWGGYALGHQPLDFFQSNQFWPLDDTLAFSDALLGYAPAGLIGSGPEAAVVALRPAVPVRLRALLLRRLPARPRARARARRRRGRRGGVRVRALPARAGRAPARDLERRDPARARRRAARLPAGAPGPVFAAFAIATWQFIARPDASGCRSSTCSALLGAIAAVVWWRRGRPPLPRRMVFASVAGAALLLVAAALIARPYLRVADEQPDAERPPSTVEAFSDSPQVFAVAPDENLIWGGATAAIRDELQNPQEKTLFPGLAILGAGDRRPASRARSAARAADRPRDRASSGPACSRSASTSRAAYLWPYRIVYELLPGWDGIRTPGTAVHVRDARAGPARRRRRGRAPGGRCGPGCRDSRRGRRRSAPSRCGARDRGRGPRAAVRPDRQPRAAPGAAGARRRLGRAGAAAAPAGRSWPSDNRRYLFWSTDGFPEIVNGRSSVQPEYTQAVIDGDGDLPRSRQRRAAARAGDRAA